MDSQAQNSVAENVSLSRWIFAKTESIGLTIAHLLVLSDSKLSSWASDEGVPKKTERLGPRAPPWTASTPFSVVGSWQ